MTTQSLASHNRFFQLASPWFVPAGLVVCWQIFAASGLVPHRVLPSPAEIGESERGSGCPRSTERGRVAEDALGHVGLQDRAREWPSVLSGGQRQRVALARALASDANLLLLDEPLGALDALTRLEMQALIEKLWLERRFSAILVTHDVEEAVALADRVLLMEGGRMTLETAVALERPRDRAGAEFTALKEVILERILGRRAL